MYALFKDGKQITQGYDAPDEIPVQTEYCEVDGRPGQRLLWPRAPLRSHSQDGYEIRVLD